MANIFALHSVGNSIATYLRNTYPAEIAGRTMPACTFDVISCGALAADFDEEPTRITLLLYRATMNEHARQQRTHVSAAGISPLTVDLHYLLTAWGGTAAEEQTIFAWSLRQLHEHPLLDASTLSPEAGWARDEAVQIVPHEIAVDDMMRIWDALDPSYRLSAAYIARLVRIDPDELAEYRPVVATRLNYAVEADA
jgi:hypothetical protein